MFQFAAALSRGQLPAALSRGPTHFWGYFEILSSRVFLVFFLCYRPLKYTHIKILSENLLIYKYKYI